jgi:hypothetical protein
MFYVILEKARTKGAKDKKPRKRKPRPFIRPGLNAPYGKYATGSRRYASFKSSEGFLQKLGIEEEYKELTGG